jgi:hypothetical protein
MKRFFAVSALTCSAAFSGCVVQGPYATQVSAGVGLAPECPYGYFDSTPYDCAPYGYYGPDWFIGGAFIGAGPWFHGPRGFYGHVDNRFDPHNGYVGPMPNRGEHAFAHFHANEARDGQGHVGSAGHEGGGEHVPGAERRR